MRLDQVVDLLAEPRLPLHPDAWLRNYSAARRGAAARGGAEPEPPTLVLSFDVEQDLGSLGTADRWDTCYPFLAWLADVSGRMDWQTTLFVQGSIVESLRDLLRPLADRHELGLHGHFHELWGRPLWFARQPGTPVYLRRELLKEGLRAFARADLPRPRAFRAPNLVCDDATLDLLAAADFRLDSSAPAFRGAWPLISRHGPLWRVPVSASPRPEIRRRWGIPTWARYQILNLRTLLEAPLATVIDLAEAIVRFQHQAGCAPHLVVLAHPWEFANVPLPGCGSENMPRLEERVARVCEHLGARVRPLGSLVPGGDAARGRTS